jgi:hypothetical protein
MPDVEIIKPVKFDGVMIIHARTKRKGIKELEDKFKRFAKRNKLKVDVRRERGKADQIA